MPKRATGAARLVRLLLSLLALIAVAAASAATTWLWASRSHHTAPTESALPANGDIRAVISPLMSPPAPIFLSLDAFTVTLENSSIERMVHLRMALRMDDVASRERIERYMPEARSRVLMVLSSQSPDSIVTLQGKMDLANAVRTVLAEPFRPLTERQSVGDVLFTEFVVQ